MDERYDWTALRKDAARRLSDDFSQRVQSKAHAARLRRLENRIALMTLLVCAACVLAVAGGMAYREHSSRLAEWREFGSMFANLERGL